MLGTPILRGYMITFIEIHLTHYHHLICLFPCIIHEFTFSESSLSPNSDQDGEMLLNHPVKTKPRFQEGKFMNLKV